MSGSIAHLRPMLGERAFRVDAPPSRDALRIGAEVELIPVLADGGGVCPFVGDATATLPFLRAWGAAQGWSEWLTAKGVPGFCTPDGGRITFEPGGQIEYSAPPSATASALLRRLRGVVEPLRAAARDAGIELLSVGIDPMNGDGATPLQVTSERYEAMAAYFASISTAGARMMRQTASIQVCLDAVDEIDLQWRVLNAAAPVIVAMFATSPRYGDALTSMQSVRADAWRRLDPKRTGLPWGTDGRESYLDFALRAPSIFHREVHGGYAAFGDLLASGAASLSEWDTHLSTLFPEVRPRGYLEVRSADAIDPAYYAAPIALLAGIAYHEPSLRAAAELLGVPSEDRLRVAGTDGLRDPSLARDAASLVGIAFDGCDALGEEFLAPSDIEIARDFFDRYTRRGRSPADDERERAVHT